MNSLNYSKEILRDLYEKIEIISIKKTISKDPVYHGFHFLELDSTGKPCRVKKC